MSIVIDSVKQGSDEWMALRLGIPTASNFGSIITATGGRSATWDKYLDKLATERVTGRRESPWELSAFKRGKEMEPESRLAFEWTYNRQVTQVGFVFQDERKRFGCSPDGLVDWTGGPIKEGFETKDAKCSVQLKRLEVGTLPSEYHRQVQGSIYVCEAERWHFRSYCSGMRPLDVIVERDDKFISKLGVELEAFCDELDELTERYRNA